jgi:hypothetical protein
MAAVHHAAMRSPRMKRLIRGASRIRNGASTETQFLASPGSSPCLAPMRHAIGLP